MVELPAQEIVIEGARFDDAPSGSSTEALLRARQIAHGRAVDVAFLRGMLDEVVGDGVVAEILHHDPPLIAAVGKKRRNADAAIGQEVAHLEERGANVSAVFVDFVGGRAGGEHGDRAVASPERNAEKAAGRGAPLHRHGLEGGRIGITPADELQEISPGRFAHDVLAYPARGPPLAFQPPSSALLATSRRAWARAAAARRERAGKRRCSRGGCQPIRFRPRVVWPPMAKAEWRRRRRRKF